jgi:hypothetical protein
MGIGWQICQLLIPGFLPSFSYILGRYSLVVFQFPSLGGNYEGRVSTVVVFIIGGFTYEDAAAVHQLNASLGLQVETLSLFIALHCFTVEG